MLCVNTIIHIIVDKLYLASARAQLLLPYYAKAVTALTFKENTEIPTMRVSSNLVAEYNPNVEWTLDEMAGVILHEVSHVLREHHKRGEALGGDFDSELWNRATDFTINASLLSCGITLPKDAIRPPHTENTWWNEDDTPEKIYLDEKAKSTDKNDKETKSTNDSGCGGCVNPGEDKGEGMTGSEVDALVSQVSNEIINATPGTVPDSILREAKRVVTPEVNYLAVIRHVIGSIKAYQLGRYDYTYSRPRRRNANPQIIFPAQTRPPSVKLLILVDTSGSVDDVLLSHYLAQVRTIARLSSIHASVGFTDANDQVELFNIHDRFTIRGGGGTDMVSPLIATAPGFDCVFIFSGGYFIAPAKKPPELKRIPVFTFVSENVTLPNWLNQVKIGVAPCAS